jgi:ATP-binding cassette subfamily C protein CydD
LLGTLEFGAWGRQLSLGEAFFILLLAPAFFEPLRELSAVWHDRAAGEAALDALARLEQSSVSLPGARMVAPLEGGRFASPPAVHLRSLCFAHPGEAAFFDDFELRVGAGEHVALMGPSGGGKTALLSLIAGLVPATSGEIAIGGVLLSGSTAASLRARIAWMGQKPHVFAGSVHDNVALGRVGVQKAQVDAAIKFAALRGVTQAHSGAALGEGGLGLSGGEVARLALARIALCPDADILLVDEPTAHLDADTARRVTEALIELARGKTLIVATHDSMLAGRMNRVIRLDALPLKAAA